MPADTSKSWALRDIGRAKSEVVLKFMYYDDDGTIQNNYQEAWINNLSSQQNSEAARVYPADHWSSGFEANTVKWEPLLPLGAYKLHINQLPDAPQQTLIFGYLGPESSAPDLTIADETYAPASSEYISLSGLSGGGVAPSQPTAGTDTGTGSFSFLPPIDTTQQTAQNVVQQELFNDTPFIPSSSSVLTIADTIGDDINYKQYIKDMGIRVHNIWKMSSAISNVKYIRNYGPWWGDSRYAGATATQSGGVGSMKVKVNANRAAALMYRVAPMDKDIGVDSAYPWIFPFIDHNSNVRHFYAGQKDKWDGLFGNENRNINNINNTNTNINNTNKDERANVGFLMEIDISAETPRGAFFQGGGGSPTIRIMWGGPQQEVYAAKSTQNFLSAFSVHCAGNKIPYLVYYNGNRNVKVYLANSAINFQQGSHIRLKVEYIGLTMMVQLNDQEAKFIRAYDTEANLKRTGSSPHGVWTDNPNISMFVMNCVADFSFMPVYYNSWDPAQQELNLGTTDLPATAVKNIVNSNPILDTSTLYPDINNIRFDPNWPITGFVKINGVANFSTYSPNHLTELLEDVVSSFQAQTYHPRQLKDSLSNVGLNNPDKQWKEDSGWPQCILDNRNLVGTHTVLPIVVKYNIGAGLQGADGTLTGDMGILNQGDPSSSLSILWQVFTTFTTPILFGFKAKGNNQNKLKFSPEKLISPYVTEWTVNWATEKDYKILQASAVVTLVNPPGWLIDVVSKNRMVIQIKSAGYISYGQAVSDTLKPYVFRPGVVFTGLTIKTELTFGPGGNVYFKIHCEDFMRLLKDFLLETNLRFDGVSYYTALCMLMQASDYGNMFVVVDDLNNWIGQFKPKWIDPSTSVLDNPDKITWDGYAEFGGYGEMFFGFLPLSGTAFEVKSGSNLYQGLSDILDVMHNPRALPLFYFDPTIGDNGTFILRVRKGSSLVSDRRPIVRSEITDQSELEAGLPLLCVGNAPAYTQISNTSALVSHLTSIGSNRVDGVAMKYTGTNPRWNSLKKYSADLLTDNTGLDPSIIGIQRKGMGISTEYGHVGYKKRLLGSLPTMLPDIASLQGYTSSRLWWLMRPDVSIEGMTVYGIIDVGVDGIINVNLGGIVYSQTLLKKSTISYKAADGALISQFDVLLFPPFTMTGGS